MTLNIDTFSRPPVRNAECVNGTDKKRDAGNLLKYIGDDFYQGYGEIKML